MVRLLLAVLLLFAAGPANAQKPVLLWQNIELPPLSIARGPHAGTGFVDLHLKWYERVLDDYEHRFVVAPTARIMADAAADRPFCTATLLRTPEREAVLRFSAWSSSTLPNALVVRRGVYSQIEHLIDSGGVDLGTVLETVLASGRLRLAYARGAVFGPVIDAALAEHAQARNVTLVPERRQSLLMVLGDRVDMTFAYPVEVEWLVRSEGLPQNYRILPIKGVPRALGYVGCTPSVPAQILERLNAAITAPGARDALRRSYAEWLDRETATIFLGP